MLLTDVRGQVVDRRAADTGILTRLDRIELAPGFLYSEDLIGTNAIGTAIAQQAPSVVTGTEHFADALTSMACAAIPVTDGAGEMIGVIDLTCAAEDFNWFFEQVKNRPVSSVSKWLRQSFELVPGPVREAKNPALQPSGAPCPDQVRRAAATTLRRLGVRGCAAQVAGEFGDHPDTAVARMSWALATVHAIYPAPAIAPAPRLRSLALAS